MYLCILGQTERARALIAAGAQVNRLGWTPLHYAASKAQVETARMLIGRGAIVNAPGPDGTTPLMMAALSGKPEIVRLLLSKGADPAMINAAHETAADWARKRNHESLAAGLDDLVARNRQARQGGRTQAAGTAPAHSRTAAPDARTPEAKTEDLSSFSRYFDADRFEPTPSGQ
jgi:ankyrin repeat protein